MRQRMTIKEVRKACGWILGEEGEQIADLWSALNDIVFFGALRPAPISFPQSLPYGHCIGQTICEGGKGEEQIEIQNGKSFQGKADILLHEMLHQSLSQQNRNISHNSDDWCGEIMRITALIWGEALWASRVQVGKEVIGHKDGRQIRKSVRRQAESPDGVLSAPMDLIKTWPDSFGLHVPVDAILYGRFKARKRNKPAKQKRK